MSKLVLGNSHIACIKQAWEEFSNAKKVFFAGGSSGHGDFFRLLSFDSKAKTLHLKPDAPIFQKEFWKLTTGSEEPLNLSEIREIYVVGFIRAPNPWHLHNCPADSGLPLDFLNSPPISFSLYSEIASEIYALEKAAHLHKRLKRASSSCSVLFVPRPLIREDAASFSPAYMAPGGWNMLTGAQRDTVARNEGKLYRKLSKNVGIEVYIPEEEIVVDGYRCPSKYSLGALGSQNFAKDSLPQHGDDPAISRGNLTHKNKAYGKYLLERVLFAKTKA